MPNLGLRADMINTHTDLYAVLGHPIKHSLSPLMHNTALRALGLNATYLAFDVPPSRLPRLLPALQELGFLGLNLTVPLKEKAFDLLADLDESALQMRSVNTIKFFNGRAVGYSTDGAGFLLALQEEFGITVTGKRVCVLGCGGAGRAVAIACAFESAAKITLVNRSFNRAAKLAEELRQISNTTEIELVPSDPLAWQTAGLQAEIIVQATSIGLHPEDQVFLGAEAFHAGQWFYDLIYHVQETVWMKKAKEGGARAVNGLGMLLHQGAKALEIWTGRLPPLDAMRNVLRQAVYKENTYE